MFPFKVRFAGVILMDNFAQFAAKASEEYGLIIEGDPAVCLSSQGVPAHEAAPPLPKPKTEEEPEEKPVRILSHKMPKRGTISQRVLSHLDKIETEEIAEDIAQDLKISDEQVDQALAKLEKLGLVRGAEEEEDEPKFWWAVKRKVIPSKVRRKQWPKLTKAQKRVMSTMTEEWVNALGMRKHSRESGNILEILKQKKLVKTKQDAEFGKIYTIAKLGKQWQEDNGIDWGCE